MSDRAYKLTLVPERTETSVEYVVIRNIEEFEDDPALDPGFFDEIVDDRYPGYIIDDIEAVSVEHAEKRDPFEVG